MSFYHRSVNKLDGLNFCLVLASADLLGDGRRGGFSSLTFPDVTVTVGICSNWCFRRCSPFVDLFRYFHLLEHSTRLLVGFHIKIPSLKIGLFSPFIWNCMQENLVELFMCRLLGEVRSWEEIKEVVHLCQPCRKMLECHDSRFYALRASSKCIGNKYSSRTSVTSLR